jgi:hypothetical protein
MLFAQNFGAKKTTGAILLFLHSDTILPPGWANKVILAPFYHQLNTIVAPTILTPF